MLKPSLRSSLPASVSGSSACFETASTTSGASSPSVESLTPTTRERADSGEAASPETLVFVDVDGVLNVGIKDSGQQPVILNKKNLNIALKLQEQGGDAFSDDLAVQQILEVSRRRLGEGGATYAEAMLADSQSELVDELVARLAGILRAAGERRTVVLSSTWREPKRLAKVQRLEASIAEYLGEPFAFDARTASYADVKDVGVAARLQYIGDFVEEHCVAADQEHPRARPLRLLVLDDFGINDLGGVHVPGFGDLDQDGSVAVADVEDYLRSRAGLGWCADISAKLVHTYATWAHLDCDGDRAEVRIGTGLADEHVAEAHAFLGPPCAVEPCANTNSRPGGRLSGWLRALPWKTAGSTGAEDG